MVSNCPSLDPARCSEQCRSLNIVAHRITHDNPPLKISNQDSFSKSLGSGVLAEEMEDTDDDTDGELYDWSGYPENPPDLFGPSV